MEDKVVWRTKSLSVNILLYHWRRIHIMSDIQLLRIEDGLIICAMSRVLEMVSKRTPSALIRTMNTMRHEISHHIK